MSICLRSRAHMCVLFSAFILLSSIGCGDEDASIMRSYDECVESWQPSYHQRFQAGDTFFLPSLSDDTACNGVSWRLETRPPESNVELILGRSYARITPDADGAYIFILEKEGKSSSTTLELDVVDALERPFHNYNYFPSPRAAAWVEDELWVAGVYTPQVARLDAATQEPKTPVLVGQWPVALTYAQEEGVVLVANKASDTLGFIDVNTGKMTDAVWVGDEPTNIVWDASRSLAYVALGGAGSLAVVDVEARMLVKTIPTVFDPLGLAMTPDGSRLVIASHRSGQSDLTPYIDLGVENEKDVAIVDLETHEVSGYILEVASTIHDIAFDAEGKLWVSATSNNIHGLLNDPDALSFQHEVFTLSLSNGPAERHQSADLSRQATSTGSTATIQGFTFCEGSVWVMAEGSNAAVELNLDLSENRRVPVEGRPRAAVCGDGAVWAVSSNRMEVTRISGDDATVHALGLNDARSQELRDGLEYFTGQGDGPGDNRSCNNCHADGLSDAVIWNAGPVPNQLLSRPFRWLEGTSMIGWDGYVGSVKISGYVGGSTINRRGTTENAIALGAYLASLMPSPAANSHTNRDGSLSSEGLKGREVFEGKGACTGCHSGPKTTNQQVMADGLTPGKTDVPTLVDVSRIGGWYKTGVMASLRATVADTSDKFGRDLSELEIDQVTRYLEELTGRDFFVLNEDFGPSVDAFPVDGAVVLTMSYPVLDEEANLALITLVDESGASIEATVTVDGRFITLKPVATLAPDTQYRIEVSENFQADDGRLLVGPNSLAFKTAALPTIKLEGRYRITLRVPMLNFLVGEFDWDNLVEQSFIFDATTDEHASVVAIDYGQDLVYDDVFVMDGSTLRTKALPVSVGPSFLNGYPVQAPAQDTDGDGVVDLVETKMHLSGPGIDLEDIEVTIQKEAIVIGCDPGSDGASAPVVTQDGDNVSIDWEGGALALYVTSPDANLPLGPGLVDGGTTYWVLETEAFPDTFEGPVTYGSANEGTLDVSENHGGPLGGTEFVSGECYRFSVVVDFAFHHTTIEWP